MASEIETGNDIQKLYIDGGGKSQTIHTSFDELDDDEIIGGINFVNYKDESQIESVMRLVGRDLSEPYSGMYEYECHILSIKIAIRYP